MPLSRDEAARMQAQTLAHWNSIFEGETAGPIGRSAGNDALDAALDWLCAGASSVLDFGCGNGVILIKCARRGATRLTGIDLSENAVALASAVAAANALPGAQLTQGGVEALEALPDASQDAALLWNIVDNLPPEEALRALDAVRRIVRPGGRVSLKLNAYLTPARQAEWQVRTLEGDLLDDGLYLWNLTTEHWEAILASRFSVQAVDTVDYPEHEATNRLFALTV